MQANNITDLRKALFEQEKDFCQNDVFLLYTADFSHIQKFLYTVHTENALRSLRSRSFFLELLMEHYLDELLAGCGVSRANLIYSGGGHCYVLLPNTAAVAGGIGSSTAGCSSSSAPSCFWPTHGHPAPATT